jgi:CheY-like chemotaxis protein
MARILVVDDEKQILQIMKEVLEGAGHKVSIAVNGEEALDILTEDPHDLVLLDVMMPKLDGYHAAAKIHGLPKPPKIVIVTARDFEGDYRVVQSLGVSAFLSKPFSKKSLLKTITDLLDEPAT